MENIQIYALQGILATIERLDNENKTLKNKINNDKEYIDFYRKWMDFYRGLHEECICSITKYDDDDGDDEQLTTRELFDRNYYINELVRIEKKIAFYDIRQHFLTIDLKGSDVMNSCEHCVNYYHSKPRCYYDNAHSCKMKIIIEFLTRINNLDSSIFKKMSNELIIYTKDYHKNFEYDNNGQKKCREPINIIDSINIIDFRNDNNGYTIDNNFIEGLVSDIFNGYKCEDDALNSLLVFRIMYEVKLTEIAYELHNIFYKKIKDAYKKIEDKYNSIPDDFVDFDKLISEVRNNEMEIDMLEEFDYKRRKLQIREFKLLGGIHIP